MSPRSHMINLRQESASGLMVNAEVVTGAPPAVLVEAFEEILTSKVSPAFPKIGKVLASAFDPLNSSARNSLAGKLVFKVYVGDSPRTSYDYLAGHGVVHSSEIDATPPSVQVILVTVGRGVSDVAQFVAKGVLKIGQRGGTGTSATHTERQLVESWLGTVLDRDGDTVLARLADVGDSTPDVVAQFIASEFDEPDRDRLVPGSAFEWHTFQIAQGSTLQYESERRLIEVPSSGAAVERDEDTVRSEVAELSELTRRRRVPTDDE